MSELKSFIVLYDGHFIRVYEESEADNVIAEKDAEIARLNDKALQYKVLDKEHCRDLNTQERRFALQMAHHKYKRCLAMAMWCRSRACFYDTMRENNLYWGMKSDRAYKWHKRWLAIAEKFKEAK